MSIIIVILAAALFSLVLLSIYEKNWNKSLHITIGYDEEHVVEGETGSISEVVVNEKFLPLPSLIIKFPIDRSISYKKKENTKVSDLQYRSDSVVAMPYEKVTRTFEVLYTKRGYYSIAEYDLVAAEFFYRTFFAERHTNTSWIYVYPARTRVQEVRASFERMMGEYISQTFLYEDPFEFKGIRAYEPTDSMKKINWKMSARTGELMVNQFYDTNHCSITLLLAMDVEGMYYDERLLEEAIRVIRTYLELCLNRGVPVRVVTNAVDIVTKKPLEIKEGAGKAHMEHCLRQLARIDTKETAGEFSKYLEKEQGNRRGLSILVSVSQSERLRNAYEQYIGQKANGEWMILVHPYSERKITSGQIRIHYGEVE